MLQQQLQRKLLYRTSVYAIFPAVSQLFFSDKKFNHYECFLNILVLFINLNLLY